jgi:tRNA A37 threonylcarbamoyladenosine dehydratase
MPHSCARTEILIGPDGVAALQNKHVLVAGLGGVGSYAAEALARAGIGRLTLLDHDTVAPSNINRQLPALHSTIGQLKIDIMATRLRDINPELELSLHKDFLQPSGAESMIHAGGYDYVADCIDSIACKAALVAACTGHGVPVISAMGAGNRLDVTRVKIARLDRTRGCPLAREMRGRLRALKATLKYPVVYSDEPRRQPLPHQPVGGDISGRPRAVNGTISYLPPLFGMMLTGVIVQKFLEKNEQRFINKDIPI